MINRIAFLLTVIITILLTQSSVYAQDKKYFKINVKGDLVQPIGYRKWIYVGTPITPNDMNDGKAPFPAFHNVYIDPMSYEHWEKTGKFRENTILIKERTNVGSKSAASGNGYFMGDFIGLEATIKSKELFPKEPGNWGYFSFTDVGDKQFKETATAFPTKECSFCHGINAEEDFVFTQYYPILKAAREGLEK